MNQRIACYTLFDITQTNVLNRSKPTGDDIDIWKNQRNSQSNFDTILQCLSLRGSPDLLKYPHKIEFAINPTKFGFLVEHNKELDHFWYWKFEFGIQQLDVYDNGMNPFGFLVHDCHEIPMLLCDTEYSDSLPNFLDTTPELRNIYFEEIK
jgi:hypothetical protein